MCKVHAHEHTRNTNKHTTHGISINLTCRLNEFSKGLNDEFNVGYNVVYCVCVCVRAHMRVQGGWGRS